MARTSFTVTELNAHIKQLLDADALLGNVCVTGELSNYKVYPSGHHYFTLKDAESSLRCVMFRSSAQSLRFRPASGMSVAVVGRIAVFIVSPTFTAGSKIRPLRIWMSDRPMSWSRL